MITSSEYTTSEGLIIAGNKCLNDVVEKTFLSLLPVGLLI